MVIDPGTPTQYANSLCLSPHKANNLQSVFITYYRDLSRKVKVTVIINEQNSTKHLGSPQRSRAYNVDRALDASIGVTA